MKPRMKVKILSSFALLFVVFTISAQPKEGKPNTPAPIGGVGLLIAAGAALGGKKMYDKHKDENR